METEIWISLAAGIAAAGIAAIVGTLYSKNRRVLAEHHRKTMEYAQAESGALDRMMQRHTAATRESVNEARDNRLRAFDRVRGPFRVNDHAILFALECHSDMVYDTTDRCFFLAGVSQIRVAVESVTPGAVYEVLRERVAAASAPPKKVMKSISQPPVPATPPTRRMIFRSKP
jgi:dihydrodipicolinate reductase